MDEKEKPFSMAWLNSSYLETLFSTTPWQNINDILSLDLAKAVRQQFNNKQRKQIIMELLGDQFKRSYLSDETEDVLILNPPSMSEEYRKKLENEAKSWLQLQINEIALRKSCAIKADESEDQLCVEMKDYLEHAYSIISISLDRYLFSKQKQVNKQAYSAINTENGYGQEETSLLQQITNYSNKNDLRGAFKNKSILHNNSKKKESQTKINICLSSEYSELIAASILSILQSSPRRTAFVLQKLVGQQLTNNLRVFIWSDILVRHERRNIDPGTHATSTATNQHIDLLLRKKFAAGVTRGKNDLRLSDPTNTPVAGLIENAVIETYSRVFSMNAMLSESHLRQTMKILNVLYTYSRDYEPYYIFWLLPFQLCFQADKANSSSLLVYDLAMYMDLFVKNFFPDWKEIFTISEKIIKDLESNDLEFYDHLKRISRVNPKVTTKDFVQEIINSQGRNKNISPRSNSDDTKSRDLLFDPIIFIRKWIGECFAGILRPNALLYVWDQLFMSLWSAYEFELIGKALLYLLRNEFMAAFDYDDMRRVFLEKACKLRTSDIQSAYMHLSSGRSESEVAFLNRANVPTSFAESTGYAYTRPENYKIEQLALGANSKKSTLGAIGIKDMTLELTVPKTGSTSDFEPSRLCVEVTLYSGKFKLSSDETTSIPVVISVKPSLNNTKVYEVTIRNEKLIFDLSDYSKERFGDNDIVALIVVKYQTKNYSQFFLGYSKLVLCSLQKIGSVFTWSIAQGVVTRLFHPGIAPANLEKITDSSLLSSYKDRLGPGSKITLTIFDTTYENLIVTER